MGVPWFNHRHVHCHVCVMWPLRLRVRRGSAEPGRCDQYTGIKYVCVRKCQYSPYKPEHCTATSQVPCLVSAWFCVWLWTWPADKTIWRLHQPHFNFSWPFLCRGLGLPQQAGVRTAVPGLTSCSCTLKVPQVLKAWNRPLSYERD